VVSDETRQRDPTRRQLRIFGVTVTNYEERTAALLDQFAAAQAPDERLLAAQQVAKLTAELNQVLRETANHVTAIQTRALTTLSERLATPTSSD
jgi:hypothetical protein